jgi:hypothetical protein
MNRKQFILALAALAVLVGLGWGVFHWQRAGYEAVDARVGTKLLEGFRVDDVAEIGIAESGGTVTLVRGDRGWSVKERGGYPADLEPIRNLLVRLEELKVVQAEPVTDALKPRMQLVAPGAGAKPEETGTLLELKGRDGKSIARLVLGKKITKEAPLQLRQLTGTVPSGRYVWVAADPQRLSVVPEAFSSVQAKPAQWLPRDYLRAERIKAITVTGADGRERWAVAREKESDAWRWSGPGKLDSGKAQDAASALYSMQLVDAAPGVGDADSGLDQPVVVRAETFDGWTYEVRIGKPAPEDRYHVRSTLSGAVPESRTPAADEKPEDKEKLDKAFADRKAEAAATLERGKALGAFTVLVAKSAVEPFLRDRSDLVAAPKPEGKAPR